MKPRQPAAKSDFSGMEIKRESLVEYIVDQLEHAMLTNQLQAGDRLPTEAELARQLGVNRSTVGEALSVLSNRGLIERKTGAGSFVKQMSVSEISHSIRRFVLFGNTTPLHMMQLREILEPEVAAFAAREANDDDIQRIDDAVHRLEDIYLHPFHPELAKVDMDFHCSIATATRNELLILIFDGMRDSMSRFLEVQRSIWNAEGVALEKYETMLTLHTSIARAIRERDTDRARQFMREHMRISRATLNRDLYTMEWKALHSLNEQAIGKLTASIVKPVPDGHRAG